MFWYIVEDLPTVPDLPDFFQHLQAKCHTLRIRNNWRPWIFNSSRLAASLTPANWHYEYSLITDFMTVSFSEEIKFQESTEAVLEGIF